MTTPRFIELEGQPIEPGALSLPRARSLVVALTDGSNDYARLLECRTATNAESVVFEVDVELGQLRKHPIQHQERLAAVFDREDRAMPEVLALREDFPLVPHRNLRLQEVPVSLCLYDQQFRDLKNTWTAPRFVERVREWLALTAKGILHQEDQPLEPLFFAAHHVVIPDDLLDGGNDLSQRLRIDPIQYPSGKLVCLLKRTPPEPVQRGKSSPGNNEVRGPEFVAAVFRSVPQNHGIIRKKPANLYELHGLIEAGGTDLLGELRARLNAWTLDEPTLDAKLILIVFFPKTREERGGVEATDVWTFLTTCSLRELGKEIGLWDLDDKKRGQLLVADDARRGQAVPIELLHSHFSLSRRRAAVLNGQAKRKGTRIVGVGAGALGSQVVVNLVRSAYGEWTIVDDDVLFPHNLARHALDGRAQGFPKAHALTCIANSLIDGEPIARSIVADVLEPGEEAPEVEEALSGADLILDMSASVTVARHLALAPAYPGRRASLFLNPTGDDLVLLAEDAQRTIPLDSVEMQYYRALANDDRLDGHFKPLDARRRYGQSCRDVTSVIPQDLVALHAANGSRVVKTMVSAPSARISIWRSDPGGNVRRVDIGAARTIRHAISGWTICTDALLIHRLTELREAKLPSETGGVLLGSFDLDRRIVYIVDTIPSPPDSQEWPTLYIRGCWGLRAKIDAIADRTDGMLEYIGEWHSHPRGCTTAPSGDDVQVFAWLTGLMNVEGLPALMMIVGDGGHSSCYIDQMLRSESLLPGAPHER